MDTLSKMESSMRRKEFCEADLEGTGEEERGLPQPLYVPSKLVQRFRNWEIWVC